MMIICAAIITKAVKRPSERIPKSNSSFHEAFIKTSKKQKKSHESLMAQMYVKHPKESQYAFSFKQFSITLLLLRGWINSFITNIMIWKLRVNIYFLSAISSTEEEREEDVSLTYGHVSIIYLSRDNPKRNSQYRLQALDCFVWKHI